MDRQKEQLLIASVRGGDEEAFAELFSHFYASLCAYAYGVTRSRALAKDAVQDVFLKIWKGRENWYVNGSLNVYLLRAVRNQSLNIIKEKKGQVNVEDSHNIEKILHTMKIKQVGPKDVSRLVKRIWELADEMPKRRKQVFTLHRLHGLSYQEIADFLEIERKTVENHMALALQYLRDHINRDLY